ncbi:MAG: c-type cytochrome biogenesis protein CcmI, partial [Nitratireductor sp.]
MIFWIFASIVTFIATLCVVLPLARAEKDATPQIEYDKALYASRIEEIKRDQALGRISEKQVEDAIASEGRKLIALSKKLDNTTTKQNSSVNTNLHKA